MGMLNNLNQLLITKAFWGSCINFFVDFLGNYGWAIILFTIVLKLILSPLDFFQRKAMKKQTQMQASLQPQIAKLQQQYGNDRAKLNEKINELYQRNNISLKSTCLPLLITLVVTMTVFISLFNALNSIANSKDSEIFYSLHKTYTAEVVKVNEDSYIASLDGKTEDEIAQIQQDAITDAVNKQYDKLKDKHGFIWIQNLWRADKPESPFVSFKSYKKYYQKQTKIELTDETEASLKVEYNTIKDMVETENSSNNGYFVLIILAGVISFLVQYISQKSMNKNANNAAAGQTNKVMLIVMPLTMLIFASTSNALFTLYIITNSIVSAIISKVIDVFTRDKGNKANQKVIEVKKANVVEYSRNYKGN